MCTLSIYSPAYTFGRLDTNWNTHKGKVYLNYVFFLWQLGVRSGQLLRQYKGDGDSNAEIRQGILEGRIKSKYIYYLLSINYLVSLWYLSQLTFKCNEHQVPPFHDFTDTLMLVYMRPSLYVLLILPWVNPYIIRLYNYIISIFFKRC